MLIQIVPAIHVPQWPQLRHLPLRTFTLMHF